MLEWESIATVAGSAAVVRSIVQLLKPFLCPSAAEKRVLTIAVSLVVSTAVLPGRTGFALTLVNALVVAAAACGIHEGMKGGQL